MTATGAPNLSAGLTLLYGNHDGMKSIRACIYQAELDLPTLVWTRGRNFPLARLESRMMCPRCGSRRVVLMFQPPAIPATARAATR
jgi:hypothetical protein